MSITLILAPEWDQDILHFLQREVVEKGHPFVMISVEPGAKCLSLSSSLGSLSGFQVTYHWQLLDNPVTETLCYIIAADGLTKILKLLQHDLPVAMTIREGQIYLQSSDYADLLGDFNLADDSVEYWLEWVSDKAERNFAQIPVKDPRVYMVSASELGRDLKTVAKYIKLTPKGQQQSSSKKSQILQLAFSDETALIQGQANGNTVTITLPTHQLFRETVHTMVPVVPLVIDTAVKLAGLLVLFAGEVRVELTANQLLIKRESWELSVQVVSACWDCEKIAKTFGQLPESIWCELPATTLSSVLPKLAVTKTPEKEKLNVETHVASSPHYSDEFRLRVNQDHVGAVVPVKVAHPFPPSIDINFNYACFEHILNALPFSSYWAYLHQVRGLVFCNRSRTIYFSMACYDGKRSR